MKSTAFALDTLLPIFLGLGIIHPPLARADDASGWQTMTISEATTASFNQEEVTSIPSLSTVAVTEAESTPSFSTVTVTVNYTTQAPNTTVTVVYVNSTTTPAPNTSTIAPTTTSDFFTVPIGNLTTFSFPIPSWVSWVTVPIAQLTGDPFCTNHADPDQGIGNHCVCKNGATLQNIPLPTVASGVDGSASVDIYSDYQPCAYTTVDGSSDLSTTTSGSALVTGTGVGTGTGTGVGSVNGTGWCGANATVTATTSSLSPVFGGNLGLSVLLGLLCVLVHL